VTVLVDISEFDIVEMKARDRDLERLLLVISYCQHRPEQVISPGTLLMSIIDEVKRIGG